MNIIEIVKYVLAILLKLVTVILVFILIIVAMMYDSDNRLQFTKIKLEDNKVNNEIKIVHLSDLHQKECDSLFQKISEVNPDLIFITGDIPQLSDKNMKIITDRSKIIYSKNLQYCKKVLEKTQKIAPTYYVLGNHEHVFEKFDYDLNEFKNMVKQTNVNLLINEAITTNIKDTTINILGVDNSFYNDIEINNLVKDFEKREEIKIILDHYPVDFALNGVFSYMNYDIDYVFSGHEHGGQIRLPFIGGILSHEQGIFPKYAEGIHVKNNSTLIVSRGLGNSTMPIRFLNRPEVIVVKLVKP